jgi:hypothetical protein
MDNLKMKFKLHGLEFELEGNEETVKKEFENFKTFTLDLMSKGNIITPQTGAVNSALPTKQIGYTQDATAIDIGDYPAMKEIVLKDLPKSETDWILIYAFYASEFGGNTFTEKAIRSSYESTGRKNISRLNNISNNIKSLINKNYIKVHNDTEYLLKEAGIKYAQEILQGNSTSKAANRTSSKGKSVNKPVANNVTEQETKNKKSKSTSNIGFVDLKLTPAEQKSLNDFFASKKPKTQNEKVAVAMKWFIEDKKVEEVSMEEMNYLLSIAAEPPSALAQVFGNMVGSGFRWVTKGEVGKYKLSSIGENYVVNKLPKS